mmetsp:Transcript_27532/g.55029  ORF Transcript_27532/g.55029 Transcript_27532/m.55029 type:complete len:168 (-) Transcript_27532:246-749(-)
MHAFRSSRGLTSFLFLFLILLPLSASFLARAPILPSRFLPTPSRCPPTGASVGKSGGEMLSNEEEYKSALGQGGGVGVCIMFFTASWCGPCRMTLPSVRALRGQYAPSELRIYEIDVDESPDIVNLTGIESVPTIFVYKEGKIVDFTVGSVTESVLQNVVKAAFKKK